MECRLGMELQARMEQYTNCRHKSSSRESDSGSDPYSEAHNRKMKMTGYEITCRGQ